MTTPFTLPDVPGVSVVVQVISRKYKKCERCWKYTPEVDTDPMFPLVCERCASVLHTMHYDITHGYRGFLPPKLTDISIEEFERRFCRSGVSMEQA